jgi:hypothetical protein
LIKIVRYVKILYIKYREEFIMMFITIAIIIIGLLMCFLGYKIFRVWLAVSGFFLGAQLGLYLGGMLEGDVWPVVGAIVIGTLLAVFAYFLFKVGAVLIGVLMGAMVTSILLGSLDIEPVWWAQLIGAVLVGITAWVFIRPFIVSASSFLGSYMAIGGIFALVTKQTFYQAQNQQAMLSIRLPWYLLLAVIALAVLAAAAQFKLYKKTPEALS